LKKPPIIGHCPGGETTGKNVQRETRNGEKGFVGKWNNGGEGTETGLKK